MKIIEQVKLQEDIEAPWHVWTKFGQSAKRITVMGRHIALTDEGDFGTIEELREAIGFYVEQLGGTVKWSKK